MGKMTREELKAGLEQFCGTEQYHRLSPLHSFVCTDGVRFLAENAGCFWLLDLMASMQPRLRMEEALRDYQFWTVKLDGKGGCDVICERDTGDVAWKRHIGYTDFPLEECMIWVESGVALLPNEH